MPHELGTPDLPDTSRMQFPEIASVAWGQGKGAHNTAACRSERLAKYNQLLRIEEELGAEAVYAGDSWRHIGW